MESKYLLIVTVPAGLAVRDTPRPQSQGSKIIRSEAVGAQLYAYDIHYIANVPYARLVPVNPSRPEWVRVAESDGKTKYVEQIKLYEELIAVEGEISTDVADALREVAAAIRSLKS